VTKKQVIWLVIRLAGLWFLWQSAGNAIALLGSFLHLSENPELLERSTGLLLQMAGQVALSFALGLYCVGDGRILFDLLNRERPGSGYGADEDSASSHSSSTLGLP
jgi:hypothetical protein